MKEIFIKTLAVLNFSEGLIHLVTAIISFWGMYSVGVWDWRIATSPTFDIFLGIVSLVTGIVLGKWSHDHYHPCNKCESEKLIKT